MRTFSQSEIISAIRATGIYTLNMSLKDVFYVLPVRKQVNGEFAREFTMRLDAMGLRGFKDESGDCDDYGIEAWNLMRRFWRKSPGTVSGGSGVAFGAMDYVRRDGVAHEINFYVTLEDSKMIMQPWEPQTATDSYLTKQEFESCEWLCI